MLKAIKIAAAASVIAIAAGVLPGTAQARFDATVAVETGSLLQPVHYYGYGYGYRGYRGYYYPRYYGYGYRGYYAPRYYRYY
jgi:hypothetical protein